MADKSSTSGGERFTVLFNAVSPIGAAVRPDNTILISPSGDRFDDFRFKTRVEVFIRRDEWSIDYAFQSMIGFVEGEVNGADLIAMRQGQGDLEPSDFPKFFTLAPDLETYRDLVSRLGVDGVRDVLLSICDLVALGEFQPQSPLNKLAPSTAVFTMSLTRSAESFFAYKNAGPILRGLEREEFGRMSTSISVEFRLAAFHNKHELEFNFEQTGFLPKNLAVIIGKNGVGKSQTLAIIAKRALAGNGLWEAGSHERAQFNRLLAFAPTEEALSVFPNPRGGIQYVRYRRYALARSSRRRRSPAVADAIVQVARHDGSIKDQSRWDIFLKAVEGLGTSGPVMLWMQDNTLFPLDSLRIGGEQQRLERFGKLNLRKEPVRLAGGRPLRLSSGEMSFLKFAAFVSLEIDNGSLLLFDEPETHLHPNFISEFVRILNSLLAATGSAAIIATHSVYFLREVFREQISILKADGEGGISIRRPRLATFGANIGEISYFVFGEDEPSRLANELERKIVDNGMLWAQVMESYQSELSLEFLNRLRAKIDR
ncbi:AAA family ATPase [Rhizobium leguminosarum]|uniref:AAA family ATPase n=1 Tax=Rhizobium leguminosarum TaxID=384 RepID=UPI0010396179|nr:AAA family ATPase [Rhizobium leguminosarum]TBY82345.1 AAA family ATPase [Rhizobium leguminosarum bv. viciae]